MGGPFLLNTESASNCLICLKVQEWMQSLKISLPELADRSGLDLKIVEAIAQNRYTTSPQQRQRIASALGTDSENIGWGQAVSVDHMYGHAPQFGRSP